MASLKALITLETEDPAEIDAFAESIEREGAEVLRKTSLGVVTVSAPEELLFKARTMPGVLGVELDQPVWATGAKTLKDPS